MKKHIKKEHPTASGKSSFTNNDDSNNIIILNRNVDKITPENRQKLIDVAKEMFKEM